MPRRLDRKLAAIRAGHYCPEDFIIADAKDGDMAFGCATPGMGPNGRMKPLRAYRNDMARVVASDLADIMLMSVSSAEALTRAGVFDHTDVTPAVRYNDTTDIWHPRGGTYAQSPARPFRTAVLERTKPLTDLGLYAITLYNDIDHDIVTLDEYARFRDEAAAAGVRHFLEIFNPAWPVDTTTGDFASYNNDMIARILAGVSYLDRPIFLKAAYNGPAATEEIAGYDPKNLIFGILGGGAGTARDCLELIAQAEKYGARVALFGRKIYQSEDSVLMLTAMRRVIEQGIGSAEGVKAYHADLAAAGIAPHRPLAEDLELTEDLLKANAT